MTDIHTAIWQSPTVQTVAINITGAATTALFTPDAGKRFACHYMWFSVTDTDNTTGDITGTLKFQSESTPLSGDIQLVAPVFAVTPVLPPAFEFCCAGMPVFLGRANGDVFNLVTVNSGGDVDLDGFAVMTQIGGAA